MSRADAGATTHPEVFAMIAFACSGCGKQLKVPDELAGKKVKCPACGQAVSAPERVEARTPGAAQPPRPEMRTLASLAPGGPAQKGTIPPPDLSEGTQSSNPAHAGHDSSLTDFLAPAQSDDELGRLGGFRILKVLGHGGMGVVFQGEDTKLGRKVAIKAMLPHLADSKSSQQRFLREARAAAALEHDHVVAIHHVGEDRGAPFIVMPFLRGEPLDQRLQRQQALPVAEVLRIGREIAEGLGAAHAASLIHRDVKPANVWLEEPRGRVKILDFGLARASAGESGLTQQGAIIGTPAYMAPEQASGQAVDGRCDLFSLGCVLYRMCSGQAPFRGNDTVSTLMAVAMETPPPPVDLRPELPVALSELVMRLLAKKPEDRPQTAREVADALREIEADVTQVIAPPGSKSRQGKVSGMKRETAGMPVGSKAKRRSRLAWLVGGGVVALGIAAAAFLFRPAPQGALEVTVSEPGVQVFIDGQEKALQESKKTGRILLAPGEHRLTVKRGGEEVYAEAFTLERGGEKVIDAHWPRWKPLAPPARAGQLRVFEGHQGPVTCVAFSPDGRQAVSGGRDKTVRLWDLEKGKEIRALSGHQESVHSVAFSPDGRRVLSAGGDRERGDDALDLWDVETGKEVRSLAGHEHAVLGLAFLPDGKRAVSGSLDNTVRLWDLEAGLEVCKLSTAKRANISSYAQVWSLALSPDGRRVFYGLRTGTAHLVDVETGNEIHSFPAKKSSFVGAAYAADGRRGCASSTGAEGSEVALYLWDLESGKEVRRFDENLGPVARMAFLPDSRRMLLAVHGDILLWDSETGRQLLCLQGHTNGITGLAVFADGRYALTSSADGTVRLWGLPE